MKGWSGKKAIVTGFMLPTKLEQRQGRRIPADGEPDGVLLRHGPQHERLGHREDARRASPSSRTCRSRSRGPFKVNPTFESGYMTGIYELEAEGPGQVAE